jgi:SAM-dependent methyltransferase
VTGRCHVTARVTVILALLALPAAAEAPIGPLGPAGAPASAFPAPARPVAPIVSDHWSSEDARDRAGEAEQVLRILAVKPGMTVADVGAGDGYYTVRLARRLGPSGRVIAEDVMADYLDKLQRRVARETLANVTFDLGEPHDPRLPPQSVDLVLMVHMYHEVAQPYGLLYNLLPALRPGAKVAVIDLDQPTVQHGTPRDLLTCELQALGFRQLSWDALGHQREYLAVFAPAAAAPTPERIKPCAGG